MNSGYVHSLLGVYSSIEKAKNAAKELPYNASDEWINIDHEDGLPYWETACGWNNNSYKIYQCELDKVNEASEQRI